MIVQCHKTYDTFLTRDLVSKQMLSWISTYYGLDSKVLYDDILRAIRTNSDITDQALIDIPEQYKDEFQAFVDDIRNNTVLYFAIPYKTYVNYEEAFRDYMRTIRMTPSEIVAMVQDMLKQRNFIVELDHDIISITFDKLEASDDSIESYDSSVAKTAFIASIQLSEKEIEELLKGTTFKKIYATKLASGNYSHLTSDKMTTVNHNMTLANSRAISQCDFMIIPNPEDMKDYITRSIYIEAVDMINNGKNVYILNRYVPSTFWGRALTELDNILTIEGNFDMMSENRNEISESILDITVEV